MLDSVLTIYFDMLTLEQACLPYVLPILDGIETGKNVYEVFPVVGQVLYGVFGSTLAVFTNVPFLSFGVFIALTFAARNQELPRLVRFSIQQAILLDIGLIIFGLLAGITKVCIR